MGIKGLKDILKKNAKEPFCEISLKDLKGKRVCIDSSILLYKFRYLYKSDNFHILGFLNKLVELLSYRIIPVFVFDGKPPDAKSDTLLKRIDIRNKQTDRINEIIDILGNDNSPEFIDSDSETETETESTPVNGKLNAELKKLQKNTLTVSKNHSLEVMELLKSIGIPFLQAPSEAEEYCAFLKKRGFVDYILSEDTDSLTFGGTGVLFNNLKNKSKYFVYNLDPILNDLELTYPEFVDFCILCGCDYTCTIPKVGPVNALKFIKKYKSIEAFILENKKFTIPENFDYKLARVLFTRNEEYQGSFNFNFGDFDNICFKSILLKNQIAKQFENTIINLINLFPNKFLK